MNKDERVKSFHRKVILMSDKRTQAEAYQAVEKLEQKKHGERLYKNYNSYRSSISQRRKVGKI